MSNNNGIQGTFVSIQVPETAKVAAEFIKGPVSLTIQTDSVACQVNFQSVQVTDSKRLTGHRVIG